MSHEQNVVGPQRWGNSVIGSAVLIVLVGLLIALLNNPFKSIDQQYAEMETRLTNSNSLMEGMFRQQARITAQLGRIEGELASIKERLNKSPEELHVASVKPAELPPSPTLEARSPTSDISMPPDLVRAIRERVLQRDITKHTAGKKNWKTLRAPAKVGEAMPQAARLIDPPPDVARSESQFANYVYSIDGPNVLIVDPKSRKIVGVSPYDP
jgi:hypothetical protein